MKLYNVINANTGNKVAEVMADGNLFFVSPQFYAEEAAPEDMDLDALKVFYKQQVDLFASEVRQRFIPRGAGVDLTYRYKAIEARDFKAAGYTGTEDDYPFIFKQATATGKTPQEVCDHILLRVQQLRTVGSSVEAQREKGHVRIDAALDAAEALAEKEAAITALNQNG